MELPNANIGGNIFYSPSPGSYAVIRLNPVEMVRPFDDAQALLEAQAMRPKSYLIMLQMELGLPWRDQPWYRFEVEPIATSLRPEVKTRSITSDLCIPIYPNTSHPTGRIPVKPEPEGLFPYDNCYHWFDAKLVGVRIRARPEEFDETNAVKLSVRTRMQMMRFWEQDGPRMHANRETFQSAESEPEKVRPPQDATVASRPADASDPLDVYLQRTTEPKDAEVSSVFSSSSVAHSRQSNHSLDDLAAMGIFSGPNDDVELVPLVNLWISELANHLKQEDIPSPLEMYAEFDQIARIVQEARIRSYAALTVAGLPESDNIADSDLDSSHDVTHDHDSSPHSRSARWVWRKLRAQAKQAVSRMKRVLSLLVYANTKGSATVTCS